MINDFRPLSRLAIVLVLLFTVACGDDAQLATPDAEQRSDASGDAAEQDDISAPDAGNSDTDPEDISGSDANSPDASEQHDGRGSGEDIIDAGGGEDSSSPDAGEQPELNPDDDYILPAGTKFVWPTAGWVTSNHYYPYGNNKVHNGSADIALPYWTDIGAARGGVVDFAGKTGNHSYSVGIDHGDGYTTRYAHLSEQPLVSVGDTVVTGQLLGYAGRTGLALNGGSHLHFAISKDGTRLVIPELEHGDWVPRGEAIKGDYPELSELSETGNRFFEVKVHEDTHIREEPRWDSALLSGVTRGERLIVSASKSGYYRVRHQAQRGYIGHTATRPLKSDITTAKTTRTSNVRDEPNMSGEVVGQLDKGELVTVFEERGSWRKILFDYPADYQWTNQSNLEPTKEFKTRIRAKNANIRSGPGTENNSLGLLPFYTKIDVLDTQEGWYKIDHEGQTVWLAGWLTQGQI